MTPEQFAYWLQGFAELNPNNPPNAIQWKQIQDHLNTVFKKVTPSYPTINPVNPMSPIPYMPQSPLNPWTSPGGIPPVITCSVTSPGAGTNWSSGAGMSYDYTITSTQYSNKKNNERLKL